MFVLSLKMVFHVMKCYLQGWKNCFCNLFFLEWFNAWKWRILLLNFDNESSIHPIVNTRLFINNMLGVGLNFFLMWKKIQTLLRYFLIKKYNYEFKIKYILDIFFKYWYDDILNEIFLLNIETTTYYIGSG